MSKVFVVCRALTIEFSALTRRDEKPLGPAVRLLILKKGPQIYMFAKKFSFLPRLTGNENANMLFMYIIMRIPSLYTLKPQNVL